MAPVPRYLLPKNLTVRAKKLKTRQHLYDFILHMTPAQKSICREALHQMSGKSPSSIYGGKRLIGKLKSEAARKRAAKIALMHHEDMARHVVQDKEVGAGFGSFFKRIGRVAAQAAQHVARHADTYGALASGIGEATGLIGEDHGGDDSRRSSYDSKV